MKVYAKSILLLLLTLSFMSMSAYAAGVMTPATIFSAAPGRTLAIPVTFNSESPAVVSVTKSGSLANNVVLSTNYVISNIPSNKVFYGEMVAYVQIPANTPIGGSEDFTLEFRQIAGPSGGSGAMIQTAYRMQYNFKMVSAEEEQQDALYKSMIVATIPAVKTMTEAEALAALQVRPSPTPTPLGATPIPPGNATIIAQVHVAKVTAPPQLQVVGNPPIPVATAPPVTTYPQADYTVIGAIILIVIALIAAYAWMRKSGPTKRKRRK